MSTRRRHPCPRCQRLTTTPTCEACTVRPKDDKRPSARERGYDSAWDKARKGYLGKHPLCAECERKGLERLATVVDHIVPHRGDKDLFWDSDGNWQALCTGCHNRKTGRGE